MNNDKFYDSLSAEVLEDFAKKTFGENPPSDLEELMKFLVSNSRILEVGCGTGRLGIELIKENFIYSGIDKFSKYLDVFKSRLNKLKFNPNNFQILNSSFEDLPEKKYDAILFSWTIIGDFSKSDQMKVLNKTYRLLAERGSCILDNPSKNQAYNKYGVYNPTPFYYDEWKEVLTEIGFKHESKIYITKTGVERELIVLFR